MVKIYISKLIKSREQNHTAFKVLRLENLRRWKWTQNMFSKIWYNNTIRLKLQTCRSVIWPDTVTSLKMPISVCQLAVGDGRPDYDVINRCVVLPPWRMKNAFSCRPPTEASPVKPKARRPLIGSRFRRAVSMGYHYAVSAIVVQLYGALLSTNNDTQRRRNLESGRPWGWARPVIYPSHGGGVFTPLQRFDTPNTVPHRRC